MNVPIPGDLRHAMRRLARAPLFALAAVATLALGIGANAAIFSVVHGVLLKPLPYQEPERLVGVWHRAPGLGRDVVNQSPALHFTYREENRVFEDVGMWDNAAVAVTGEAEPERVPAMLVSHTIFPILGAEPVLGRSFTEEEDEAPGPLAVVLSHAYWQRRFGGDAEAIGETLRIDGRTREIVGVMPRDFRFLDYEPDLYLPFQFDRSELHVGNFSYQSLARLRSGVSLEAANADVDRMIPLATEKFPRGLSLENLREARFAGNVRPLFEDVVGDVGSVLWVLFGTVGLVLLIACANVANLFLVRADGRQREIALRVALGADRKRVAKEFLLESLTLGLLGGLLGLGLALASTRLLVALRPESLPRLSEIDVDASVLLFTLALAVLSSLFFGLFPVWRYGRPNVATALKEGGRASSDGRERSFARSALVVSQLALALVLLVGSGLMIRSFAALRNVAPGFVEPDDVLTFRITLPRGEVGEPEARIRTYEQILRRVEAIAGVSSVGISSSVTMDGWDSNDAIEVEGFPIPENQIPPIRRLKWIAESYFETMGNPVLAGRPITWADVHAAAPVAVVTENFASEYWSSPAEAVGKRIRQSQDVVPQDVVWREIVGVVGNVHDDGVDEPAEPVVYWPLRMKSFWGDEDFAAWSVVYALRTPRVGSPGLMQEIRKAVWSVNRNLPIANVQTLREILDASMARTSFTLVMLALASAVALVLGIVGVYGVISYAVSQRTREIGLRMALGAERADVSRLVLRDGAFLTALGLALGLVGALAVTRLMGALLFGVSASDPVTYAATAATLAAVALGACYLPARRASRLDPTEALRWE